MNKNLLIGLVVILLVVGGFVMVQNSSKTEAPTTTVPQTQDQQSATEEQSPTENGEAMMRKEESAVTLTNAGFEPKTITVKVGDEVVWLNKSGGVATVDSAQHPTHLVYPKLNLGNFDDGEEHRLVFNEVGKYNYHDHLNPSRFGTVVVE